MAPIFAHSLAHHAENDWELLADHLALVGQMAALFAGRFGANVLGNVAGRLHDIGKMSAEFQAYIRGNGALRGPDHATAGAREAVRLYGDAGFGRILAYCIAGHHSGLADGGTEHLPGTLTHRLNSQNKRIEAYEGWEAQAGTLPEKSELRLPEPLSVRSQHSGFERAFFIRMLFSALVDADFLATEQFYAQATRRGFANSLEVLRDRLDAKLTAKASTATEVNRLRSRVLAHVRAQASQAPGLFSLTVPTGGGKTLTSLAFALDHAIAHGLDRIVYVIPYTSIIEQTAQVFRDALGNDGDVLEHHSAVEWDPKGDEQLDDEGKEGLKKLRRDAENWDVRIVVTTSVQFFESLFAARTSACRKLHNLAKSVIILDEAQTLPLPLLRPCMAAIETLATGYGASVVLCTATQPALRKQDGFEWKGLENVRELAPDPDDLYRQLKRVRVAIAPEPVSDDALAEQMRAQEQVLCIVNSRPHARDLFARIKDAPGARHLTTLMCPLHRRAALAQIRQDLKDQKPVRLIATSLIEAGVDVDFPTVWRAMTGLDSIAQAAGRCNREGLRAEGIVNVFRPDEVGGRKPPPAIEQFAAATREVLRTHGDDPLGLEAIKAYFAQVYWSKGPDQLDAAILGDKPNQTQGILSAIEDTASALNFPFAEIASAFRFVDDTMQPVIVPYHAEGPLEPVESLINSLRFVERPGAIARKLALYSVPVPRNKCNDLISSGAARYVEPEKFADQFVLLENFELYSSKSGLDWQDTTFRSSESNIIS
ncbi:CRISPR-associated helicase Cas3' [Novosphingobium sp. AAP83]|uniref:CRISPR-associated helicase Cas3' n=1 Tax=Novosphingobium sp. AAP83 TaxID=1523425 RepID=UPI0018D1A639|nr:CRISPR-associated helicase Cas3' [Novosphingobium sp. AAP83]